MADLVVTGTLLVPGLILMTGGAGTYFQPAGLTLSDISLMVADWSLAEQGREFYCTDLHQWLGWNGSSLVILG